MRWPRRRRRQMTSEQFLEMMDTTVLELNVDGKWLLRAPLHNIALMVRFGGGELLEHLPGGITFRVYERK